MKKKPSFILFEKEEANVGLKMLWRFFVEERKFDIDVLRTLIMKYPSILGKKEEQLSSYFTLLSEHNVGEDDAMKYLLECPRLISFDLHK